MGPAAIRQKKAEDWHKLAHLDANCGVHPLAIHAGNRRGSRQREPEESMMKLILLAACAAVAFAAPASAQSYTQQTFGGTTFTNGSNGYTSTQQTFGGMTFGNDNQGNSWNVQRFGVQTFINGNGPAFNNGW
jgi:hypothetical protein